jgi:hypothetical protein
MCYPRNYIVVNFLYIGVNRLVPSLVPVEIEQEGDEQVQQKMSQMSLESDQAVADAENQLNVKYDVEVRTEEITMTKENDSEALLVEEINTSYEEAPLLPGPFNEPRKKQKKSVR